MKKAFLLIALLLLATAGSYFVDTYTSATVENPFFLRINSSQGMLSFVPVAGLAAKQGESKVALRVTNNMGVDIYDCRLEYSSRCFSLIPHAGFSLAPGAELEISVEVSNDCSTGPHLLEISFCGEFAGGRAKVKTRLPIIIVEMVQIEKGPAGEKLHEAEENSCSDEGEKGEKMDGAGGITENSSVEDKGSDDPEEIIIVTETEKESSVEINN